MTVLDVQISPAVNDWAAIRDAALVAESAGFGAFHVFDHLAGRSLGGDTMIEGVALLGALAEATSTIELGAMVMNVWNRQVGTLVAAAASIAHLSARRFHFGIGAGAAPDSRWAAEQLAVGHVVESDLAARQRRVGEVLDLARATWRDDRTEHLSTFPLPSPVPSLIVGVNSVGLSELAGRLADGINVPWNRPGRDDFLAAADAAAGDRPFVRTAYHTFDPGLLDPDHPARVEMTERRIDRLVLAHFGPATDLPGSV